MKLRKRWPVIYILAVIAFAVYTLLDTFVITRVYSGVEAETVAESDESDKPSSAGKEESTSTTVALTESTAAPVVTDATYEDENIRISITEYRENDTTIYVADITLSDPSYLKTALAKASYGKNVTDKTSSIAEDAGAILAINGDYYGARNTGYVIRGGVLYRSSGESGQEDLVIYEDGSFEIIDEGEVTAEELLARGAREVLSFGPGLIEDGQIIVSEQEEVGKAMASNPRTAIGMYDDLHYVFVVSDGRTSESEGLSLYEMAQFLESLGVRTAYNLDGGGSSTMVFNGEVVNNPTTSGRGSKERSVSDIVYIG